MPAAMQVKEVAAKLKDRNPGFDGKVMHKSDADVVTEFALLTRQSDRHFAPSGALTRLRKITCSGNALWKKGPACRPSRHSKGMKLTELHCLYTQVSDLSPLKDMQLTELLCWGTQVSDSVTAQEHETGR